MEDKNKVVMVDNRFRVAIGKKIADKYGMGIGKPIHITQTPQGLILRGIKDEFWESAKEVIIQELAEQKEDPFEDDPAMIQLSKKFPAVAKTIKKILG